MWDKYKNHEILIGRIREFSGNLWENIFTRGSKIIVDYDTLKDSNEEKSRSKVLEIAIELKY
jgi:hypothetical protein